MDPFTQMLLERTKASRSKLEAKLSNTPQPLPRKRRSPLQDNILTEKEQQQNDDSADDSPGKRQCVESVENKPKTGNSKENKPKSTLETRNKPQHSITTKQERTLNRVSITESSVELDSGDNIQVKRTNRLAKLAQHINSWEDDIKGNTASNSRSPTKVAVEDVIQSNSNNVPTPSPSPHRRSVSADVAENIQPPVITRRVSKSPEKKAVVSVVDDAARSQPPCIPKATPRRRSSSFSASTTSQPAPQLVARKKSFSAEKRTNTKTILWDQAVVATLEAQGFIQSPSKSKLEYKFSSAPTTPRKKNCDTESSSESETESEDDVQTSPKSVTTKSPIKIGEPGRISVKQLAQKFAVPLAAVSKGPQKDPTELPVSARVALFEKGNQLQFNSGSNKAAATNLSASKNFKKVSPQKITTPQQQQVVVPKENASAENKPKHSPTKPVGAHTFQLHRQLFEHGKDWKDNEISLKIKEDREKDMEVVLNRWSHKTKVAAENAALSVTNQRVASQVPHLQPARETQTLLRSPSVKREPPVPPPLPPANPSTPRVSFAATDSDSADEGDYEESLSETESDDEDLKNLEPPVDSEEEINRALAVVDAICTDDDEETDLDSSILKEAFQKIQNVTDVHTGKEKASLSSNAQFKVPTMTERVSAKKNEERRSDEEHSDPLLHTISFYRRQKEMNRYTVLKSVVRNEPTSLTIDSRSSSTDEDESSSPVEQQECLQERIKQLQEEVVLQQAVMRQASQALILCRSNEAFQGSLEQIEGERLLLVAAQKRQACLSEVERLKTDGALGVPHPSSRFSRGSLSMGDMKLTLKREFLEQTANGLAGDFVHFFVVLIKHRAQVIATQMMSTMDGISAAALHFPNLINIRDLDRDFNVIVEVYGLQTKRDCVNRDFKTLSNKKDKSKLTLTPKKRQSKKDLKMISPKVQSPGGPNVICTSSFALIGYTAINLKTLNRKTWSLEKIPYVSPLEGGLVMKVRCFSDFSNEEQGFLTMFDDVGGFGAWHRRWFVLTDRLLSYWKYPDDVKQKSPIGQIDLCQCITSDVCLVPRDICARPHTFMLLIVRPPSKENTDSLIVHNFKCYATIKVLLSADTKEERISWCQHMNRTLENLRTWEPEALRPMPEDFDALK